MFVRTGLFLLLTLFFTMALGGAQQATGLLAGQVILPQLAPGLAALIMLLLFRKDGTRMALSPAPLASRAGLLAVAFPAGAALIIFVIVSQVTRVLDVATISLANSPISLVGMIIGSVGEELGWRGYLHNMLDKRMVGWASCLIVGIPWGLWHIGLWQYGPIYVAFAVLMITSYAVVIFFIVQETNFNVWVAALFHLMINVTNVTFLSIFDRIDFVVVNALVWALIALGVVILNRARFFTQPASA